MYCKAIPIIMGYCFNSHIFRDPTGRPNQYVTAIQAVGEIIQVKKIFFIRYRTVLLNFDGNLGSIFVSALDHIYRDSRFCCLINNFFVFQDYDSDNQYPALGKDKAPSRPKSYFEIWVELLAHAVIFVGSSLCQCIRIRTTYIPYIPKVRLPHCLSPDRIGTHPPPPPLPQVSVQLALEPKGGTRSPVGEGVQCGSPNSD